MIRRSCGQGSSLNTVCYNHAYIFEHDIYTHRIAWQRRGVVADPRMTERCPVQRRPLYDDQ